MKRELRTLDQVEESYFRKHPEEIDDYLVEVIKDYAEHQNIAALLSSLRTIARVRGISALAEEIGMSRKGIQKALSEQGNPGFDNINAIMHAMGYQLVPQRLTGPSSH